MKRDEVFPSKWLKVADLQGREVSAVVSHCQMEEVGDDTKLVIYFQGKEKALVCNVTNFDVMAELYGDDSDGWQGKPVVLGSENTRFQGQLKKGLRIKPPRVATQARPMGAGSMKKIPIPSVALPPNDPMPDSRPQHQQQSENPAVDMDDDIPF